MFATVVGPEVVLVVVENVSVAGAGDVLVKARVVLNRFSEVV